MPLWLVTDGWDGIQWVQCVCRGRGGASKTKTWGRSAGEEGHVERGECWIRKEDPTAHGEEQSMWETEAGTLWLVFAMALQEPTPRVWSERHVQLASPPCLPMCKLFSFSVCCWIPCPDPASCSFSNAPPPPPEQHWIRNAATPLSYVADRWKGKVLWGEGSEMGIMWWGKAVGWKELSGRRGGVGSKEDPTAHGEQLQVGKRGGEALTGACHGSSHLYHTCAMSLKPLSLFYTEMFYLFLQAFSLTLSNYF